LRFSTNAIGGAYFGDGECIQGFGVENEEKSIERPRRKWQHVVLKEIVWDCVDRIHLAQDWSK
jgi:hypothetical protein